MKRFHRIDIPIILFATAYLLSGTDGAAQEMPVHPEPGASSPTGSVEEARPTREIKMLPTQKRALTLKPEEHNPYAKRTPELAINETVSDEETESDQIQRVLKGLVVSGRVYGPKGIRLLAGDIIFEVGRRVPPVLEDQTEILIVEEVTEEAFTVAWLDPETGEPTGKRLPLAYDLSVVVGYVLPGQGTAAKDEKGETKFGVIRRKTRNPQMAGEMADDTESGERAGATAVRLPNGVSEEVFKQGQ